MVREEATQGIHKAQFRNAIDWIAALQPAVDVNERSLAISGPTFSGSFPSATKALRDPKKLNFEIYSKVVEIKNRLWP